MYDYYCKNCNNLIGKWNNNYKWYDCLIFCDFTESKNFNKINFLDCKNCNKFIGILCEYVCENCFGKYEIIGEEILFNWFFKYKKKINFFNNNCKNCNSESDFRNQYWFFEELTFYK